MTLQKVTFDNLPEAIVLLTNEVSELKTLLLEKKENPCSEDKEQILNAKEAAKFLDLSLATIYSKVSRKEIPFSKRNGRLYFSSTELRDYIKGGKESTYEEIDQQADLYFSQKARRA